MTRFDAFQHATLVKPEWKTPRYDCYTQTAVQNEAKLIRDDFYGQIRDSLSYDESAVAFFRSVSRLYVKYEFPDRLQPYCYRWVHFLTEVADNLFLLQDCLLRVSRGDSVFYQTGREPDLCLSPKAHSEWSEGWDQTLPWLRHPEQLTVPELELALCIFRWDRERPVLADWLCRYPYILPRIQRYFLSRYCWPLKDALDEAMGLKPDLPALYGTFAARRREDGLHAALRDIRKEWARAPSGERVAVSSPPFQAVRPWMRNFRFLAIALVGNVALFNLPLFRGVFVQSLPFVPLLLILFGVLAIARLAETEVYQRNQGWIDRSRGDGEGRWKFPEILFRYAHGEVGQAGSRMRGLCGRFIFYGFAATAGVGLVLFLSQLFANIPAFEREPLFNMTAGFDEGTAGWTCSTPGWKFVRLLFAWSAMAVYSTLFGVLLQSIWEDRPATEPF